MKIIVLGSSSSGNATCIESEGKLFLIDAGLSAKKITERLAKYSVSPQNLDAVFVTHEHTDHIQGLKGLLKKNSIPVYCTRHTAQAIETILNIEPEFFIFSPGEAFRFGKFKVEGVSVFHDAQDPVGFVFETNTLKMSLVSDIGYVTSLVKKKVSGSNILIIESNHDPKMLMADHKRPVHVKQRIRGRQGHLSNENACELVKEIIHNGLRHIVLFHLSKDCNCAEIALDLMKNTLISLGQTNTNVHLTYPNKPTEIVFNGLKDDITIENNVNGYAQLVMSMVH
ncbi:MBL fold metallo-hydrolase [bacterium]|nr:MBL fold metallo-hydrolase [bacterium]